MDRDLEFHGDQYEVKSCQADGRTMVYRAFERIPYCRKPKSDIQVMNLFVPEQFYQEKAVNGYTLKTAPVFIPNTVGGYLPGEADEPGRNFLGQGNAIFQGLCHGYVVVSPGIRGRSMGDGGKAPALIVDMKAVIRYLRRNKDVVPGNVERIVTSGTSAGGALSALAGATGNSGDYEPFLEEIGAAHERDHIFAANCYCPIHNLEHGDSAYEWMFGKEQGYRRMKFGTEGGAREDGSIEGEMTREQLAISAELKALFPPYLNGLGLKDKEGRPLTLDEYGEGSFKDYVKSWVIASAQKELEEHDSAVRLKDLAVSGSQVEQQAYLSIKDGKVTGLDWDGYVHSITRMKTAPAFDALDLKSPENQEFGTAGVNARHFTEYGAKHSKASGELAEKEIIKMMNPTEYIGKADTAKYWRIRHGAFDRDTALAIPVILEALLMNGGYQVDFGLPWGLPHSGDYDLDQLFAWIDHICRESPDDGF